MNKQHQIYHYDKASYEKHQEKIAELAAKEKRLIEELNSLDKHLTDNCMQPPAVARTEQKLAATRMQLQQLRSMDVRMIETTTPSNIVSVGRAYHVQVTSANGKISDYEFELVSAYPETLVPGKMNQITINSPLGKAIVGKEIGEPSAYEVKGVWHFVVVLDEIKQSKTQETQEEMQ